MKKVFGLFLVLACIFFNSSIAKADVIWTPDDSFFMKNEEDCEYLNRQYIVNGPGGEVIVYESPLDASEVVKVVNGTKVWVSWTYTDEQGTMWGNYDGEDGQGWLPMDYMDLVYDYISFEEDHGSEFVKREGNAEGIDGVEEIYNWGYPGSPICSAMHVSPDDMPMYSATYQDEEGRTWAFCSYYYGWRNFWLCLDDLTADHEKLYGAEPIMPTPDENEVPQIDEEPIVPNSDPKDGDGIGAKIGIGVAIVVGATAVTLVFMKKKK